MLKIINKTVVITSFYFICNSAAISSEYIFIVSKILMTRKSALRGTYTPGWCPFLSINIF